MSDASGLKRFGVAGRLFLRHELLKVKDTQRNVGNRLESIPGHGSAALDQLPGPGALKATIDDAPMPGMTEYVMGIDRPRQADRAAGGTEELPRRVQDYA